MQADTDLLSEFDAVDATDAPSVGPAGSRAITPTYEPDYNVAPTKPIRIVVNRRQRAADGQPAGDPVRQLRIAGWGLVPSWAKDRSIGARMINARAEGVASAPSFRRAYAGRRCLIPADGWYEWRAGTGAGKQAFYMTPTDGHGLAFAGLYEFWGKPGELLTTATIVTCAATGELAEVHDRMPLVLPRASWSRWLDPQVADPAELLQSWDEAAGEQLEVRPVGPKVGDHRNNGPALIERVGSVVEPQALF